MNMNDTRSSVADIKIKSPWKRLETWAFLIVIIGCGFGAGWSVSQYFVWKEAKKQFDALAFDYDESAKARSAILKMCLNQTRDAAEAAKEAAEKAARGTSK